MIYCNSLWVNNIGSKVIKDKTCLFMFFLWIVLLEQNNFISLNFKIDISRTAGCLSKSCILYLNLNACVLKSSMKSSFYYILISREFLLFLLTSFISVIS